MASTARCCNQLGTPRLITGGGGTTLAIHDYYPFGMEAYGTADGERMKFTGHELDSMGTASQTDDLYNMHARFYNANIARFLSADPLRGDPHSPQSFNLFAYVQGNPVVFVDPLGLQALNGISGGTSFDLFFDANPYQAWFSNPANYTQVLPSGYPAGWWGPMDSYWGWQHANWWSAPYLFGTSPTGSGVGTTGRVAESGAGTTAISGENLAGSPGDLSRFQVAYDQWFAAPRLGLGQQSGAKYWGPVGNLVYVLSLGHRGSSCTAWAVGLLVQLQPLNSMTSQAVEVQRWLPIPHTLVGIQVRDPATGQWTTVDIFDPFWRFR